jgi:hypothetical protein
MCSPERQKVYRKDNRGGRCVCGLQVKGEDPEGENNKQ